MELRSPTAHQIHFKRSALASAKSPNCDIEVMATHWNLLISQFRRWGRRCLRFGRPDPRPTGPAGIQQLGHREYVGGRWEEIGKLQFDYLRSQGLRPEHWLLDVACGSLRAGVHLIPYLQPGHYIGLEKEPDLIQAGLLEELDPAIAATRCPQFIVTANFDVTTLLQPVDYIWMHSLWTHLPLVAIEHCLTQLKSATHRGTVCYATFFESETPRDNERQAHDHETFYYTTEELTRCAAAAGWRLHYIGDWGHPRGQHMVRLTPSESISASHDS